MATADTTVTRASVAERAWEELGERLRDARVVLTSAERDAFLAEWENTCAAEAALDDRLLLGLVGGTGVGKSTLINALAAQRISQAGDRRPTTNRIVVYRHESTELPAAFAAEDIADPQVLHRNEVLERVVLFDFPDFDSVEKVHHEIFHRYVPELDVVVVLVDDVKYADARLFELLRSLPQSHENLHPVLNKIDRLARRYPSAWRSVVEEILADFATKLARHADVQVDPQRMLAISARAALEEREARATDGGDAGGAGAAAAQDDETGDFGRILDFLAGYRATKRRRAAKELNFDARKRDLAHRLSAGPLAARRAQSVREALALARERGRAVEHSLAAIPQRIFRPAEREGVVGAALARAAPHVGFPLDVLWGLPGLLPWRRKRAEREEDLDLSAARIRRHYRSFFDGVANLRRELRLRAGEVGVLEGNGAGVASEGVLLPWNEIRDGFRAELARCEERLRTRRRFWNHLAPLAVLAFALWALFYPVIDSTLGAWGAGEGVSIWNVLSSSFVATLRVLSPVHVLGTLTVFLLAYLATAFVVRLRQRQRLERVVDAAEHDVRDRARGYVESALRSLEEALDGWLEEYERLREAARRCEG